MPGKWTATLQRLLCWMRHQWMYKTVARRGDVRYIRRCRRCGQVSIAYKPDDWSLKAT